MSEIPAWFWMTVIAFLSVLFGLILYYIAMLVKETTSTMGEVKSTITDSRKLIQNANVIIEETMGIVTTVKGTINEVNEMILVPVKKIGDVISSVTTFVSGFISKD